MPGMDLNDIMADSNARARSGRAAARTMFIGVVMVLGIAGFLFIAAPNGSSATGGYSGPLVVLVAAVGVLGLIVGLIPMIRILRADPEPDTKAWRYRR